MQIGAFTKRNWTPTSILIVSKLVSSYGGPDRIRTDDPYNANVVRSQLRYKPMLYSETSLAQNSRKWKGKLKKREKTFAISVLVLN